jgi:hypothetical protein
VVESALATLLATVESALALELLADTVETVSAATSVAAGVSTAFKAGLTTLLIFFTGLTGFTAGVAATGVTASGAGVAGVAATVLATTCVFDDLAGIMGFFLYTYMVGCLYAVLGVLRNFVFYFLK